MKFVARPDIDTIREQYKKEYDENFDKLVAATEKHPYQAIERKLHVRTVLFIREHAQYFRSKRKTFWAHIEEVSNECTTEKDSDETQNRFQLSGSVSMGKRKYANQAR